MRRFSGITLDSGRGAQARFARREVLVLRAASDGGRRERTGKREVRCGFVQSRRCPRNGNRAQADRTATASEGCGKAILRKAKAFSSKARRPAPRITVGRRGGRRWS